MPRLRSSAGRSIPAARSTNVWFPQAMTPPSGRWNPAIDIRVVVLPQPDGPSRVTNSLSLTVKLTSSRTLLAPNDLVRCSTRISAMAGFPDEACAEQEHDGDDGDLDDGQGGDRPDDAALPVQEHGDADDLGARLLEEHHGVVVGQQGDEHQDERGQQRRPQDR